MADPISWDLTKLVPADPHAELQPFNTGGGRNALNREQVVGNSPPRWSITLGKITLTTSEQIKEFCATAAELNGRANPILVPLCEQGRAPVAQANVFDDEFGFDDGFGFDDVSPFGGSMLFRAAAAAAAGGTSIQIEVALDAVVSRGDVFGDGVGAAYRVKRVTGVNTSGTYPIYTVSISPPLRSAITQGQALETFDIRVRCVLKDDDGMATPTLELWRIGVATVEFVEDV